MPKRSAQSRAFRSSREAIPASSPGDEERMAGIRARSAIPAQPRIPHFTASDTCLASFPDSVAYNPRRRLPAPFYRPRFCVEYRVRGLGMNSPSEIRSPQNVPGPFPSRRAKIAAIAVLSVIVPRLFLFFVETVIRLAGFNTELVSMPGQKIQIPVWASQDRNFFIAQDVFQQIKDNTLPAEAAEWLGCFRVARDVQYKLKPDSRFRVRNTGNRTGLKTGI